MATKTVSPAEEQSPAPKSYGDIATDSESPIDRIERLSQQLDTLLCSFTGEGWECFSGWSGEMQHELLWTASSMARDLRLAILTNHIRAGVVHG